MNRVRKSGFGARAFQLLTFVLQLFVARGFRPFKCTRGFICASLSLQNRAMTYLVCVCVCVCVHAVCTRAGMPISLTMVPHHLEMISLRERHYFIKEQTGLELSCYLSRPCSYSQALLPLVWGCNVTTTPQGVLIDLLLIVNSYYIFSLIYFNYI